MNCVLILSPVSQDDVLICVWSDALIMSWTFLCQESQLSHGLREGKEVEQLIFRFFKRFDECKPESMMDSRLAKCWDNDQVNVTRQYKENDEGRMLG